MSSVFPVASFDETARMAFDSPRLILNGDATQNFYERYLENAVQENAAIVVLHIQQDVPYIITPPSGFGSTSEGSDRWARFAQENGYRYVPYYLHRRERLYIEEHWKEKTLIVGYLPSALLKEGTQHATQIAKQWLLPFKTVTGSHHPDESRIRTVLAYSCDPPYYVTQPLLIWVEQATGVNATQFSQIMKLHSYDGRDRYPYMVNVADYDNITRKLPTMFIASREENETHGTVYARHVSSPETSYDYVCWITPSPYQAEYPWSVNLSTPPNETSLGQMIQAVARREYEEMTYSEKLTWWSFYCSSIPSTVLLWLYLNFQEKAFTEYATRKLESLLIPEQLATLTKTWGYLPSP